MEMSGEDGAPSGMLVGSKATFGYLLAAGARVSLLALKKGALLVSVKKQAFLYLGRLTTPHSVVRGKLPAFEPYNNKAAEVAAAAAAKGPLGMIPAGPQMKYLAKSTILGVTVFGTYEFLAFHCLGSRVCTNSKLTDESAVKLGDEDAISLSRSQSSILQHYAAGACSGLAHSTVMTVWDAATHRSALFQSNLKSWPRHLRRNFVLRRALHHSIGYASLFGTFEAVRRGLLDGYQHVLQDSQLWQESQHWIHCMNDGSHNISLLIAFLAGGAAGLVHHVVSHFTSHWHLEALKKNSMHQKNAARSLEWVRYTFRQLPTVRSSMSQFGPTALCFVAFQYGNELQTRIVEVTGPAVDDL